MRPPAIAPPKHTDWARLIPQNYLLAMLAWVGLTGLRSGSGRVFVTMTGLVVLQFWDMVTSKAVWWVAAVASLSLVGVWWHVRRDAPALLFS
jgi:hypothetical protein